MNKPAIGGGNGILPENIRACHPLLPDNVLYSGLQNALNDVFESGMLSGFSKYTRKLESQFHEMLGVKHALTVSNGTTGLEILLSTLPKDSEVIVPSYTFPATVHAIVRAHLKPKFVDVDGETFNISIQDVKLNISNNTSAILAVNAFGNPCKIEELEKITAEYEIKLFFDSAAGIGAKYHGRPLGSFGDAEVFSLSGTKVVTAGEGGLITTNNDVLAKELDCKRGYGYNKLEKDCLYIGCNGKMSELNAIIALWSLHHIQQNIDTRKSIAQIYCQRLQDISGVHFQKILSECETSFYTFAIAIDPKEFGLKALVVQERLKTAGIETLRYFCPPMHKTRAYQEFNRLRLEQSEILSERNLCLPMHAHLTAEQAHTVCDAIEIIHNDARQIMQKRVAFGNTRSATNKKEQSSLVTNIPLSLPAMSYASTEASIR